MLIHGTFVDTPSTFGKLWRGHRDVVQRLFGSYGLQNIFALDHATVGSSPIDKALTLLQACSPSREWQPEQVRGVVLKGDVYVGANEVRAMRKVPELVFLNCCYLGKFSADQLAGGAAREPFTLAQRPVFAAGVADELIRVGVRCVIAAGWPIDDAAAKAFATTFYEQLFDGSAFIDAVHAARRAAWDADKTGTTWAAYQCYGDPGWRWRGGDDSNDTVERASGIASAPGLVMELEQITTLVRYGGDTQGQTAKRLRSLRDRFEGRWGNEGQVAKVFASVHAALGDV